MVKNPLLIHSVGIALCALSIIVFWWYFIYKPLIVRPVHVQQEPQLCVQENQDFISTTSLMTLLVQAADTVGMELTACYSGETGEQTAVVVQAHAPKLIELLQFFDEVTERIPYTRCTQIGIDKKQDTLVSTLYFTPLNQVAHERIISPAIFNCDPFCTGKSCKLIAQCCCPDLGINLKVSRSGDQITFE